MPNRSDSEVRRLAEAPIEARPPRVERVPQIIPAAAAGVVCPCAPAADRYYQIVTVAGVTLNTTRCWTGHSEGLLKHKLVSVDWTASAWLARDDAGDQPCRWLGVVGVAHCLHYPNAECAGTPEDVDYDIRAELFCEQGQWCLWVYIDTVYNESNATPFLFCGTLDGGPDEDLDPAEFANLITEEHDGYSCACAFGGDTAGPTVGHGGTATFDVP